MPVTGERDGISALRSASIACWEHAWEADSTATYYQSPAWAQLWCQQVPDLEPAPIVATLPTGKAVLVPLLRQRAFRGLLWRYIGNPSGSQTGWLTAKPLDPSEGRELVQLLLTHFRDLDWRSTPLQHMEGLPEASVTDFSQLVDLRDGPDAVRARWSKGHKSGYNKAAKAGIEVRVGGEEEEWERFYELYLSSLRRWRTAGEPITSLYDRELLRAFAATPCGRLWIAERHGEMIAGAFFLYSAQTAAYYLSAIDEAAFSLQPGNLLLGEIMLRAASTGLDWIELGASGGHENVVAFKRRFGAVVAPFGVFRVSSRRARALQAVSAAKARLL